MKNLLQFVAGRLAERSTVVGLLALTGTALGASFAPERLESIATLISLVAGGYLVYVREGDK